MGLVEDYMALTEMLKAEVREDIRNEAEYMREHACEPNAEIKRKSPANISREKKKAEAIRRMKALHYFEPSIEQFEKWDKVMVNEPPFGAHYYIDDNKGLVEKIRQLEEQDNILVYAVISSIMTDGYEDLMMDSLLFVEDYEEEWEYFDEDIQDKYIMSYTINWTWQDCSEYGSICFDHTVAGGLRRTA